jgi:predicted nucleic acid-binding protein
VSKGAIIVDPGPLVALLAAEEARHRWVEERLRDLSAPFVTCEPVLTEVFFLVARLPDGARRFFDLLNSGLLTVDFRVLDQHQALRKLMQKYSDLPMSLADACLVRLAELHPGAAVFTLDAHFQIYRKNGRQQIPVIMP